MHKLVISKLSKSYQLDKNKFFHALTNINLAFEETGLVGIIGKSGSGKSTLLNMIARIDEPTKGEIFLNGKKYDKKKKNKYRFYRNEVGIVFQNYQLIEDKTCLYNVALPLLTCGCNKKKAFNKARLMLDYVNIKTSLHNQVCNQLSGGEKQRVAIARAIINNQSVILCDEPTGALDTKNSKVVMELLKTISKTRLVIIVSHNLQLIDKYCDRKIELNDGRIAGDIQLNKNIIEIKEPVKEIKGMSNWTSAFSLSNFKKRIKRNLFVITSLSLSLIMGNLVFGFVYGKDNAITNATYRQLDYGYGSISHEEAVSNTGLLKLTKSVRPDLESLNKNENLNNLFEICPNFSTIIPLNPHVEYDLSVLDNISYTPIYSFDKTYYDSTLICMGQIPNFDDLNQVIINKKCYETIKSKIQKDPLNELISITHKFESNYVLENGEYITDSLTYDISCRIVAVVDELSYLSSNKIYYSYLALENYMQESVLLNLSTYFDETITWYDRVINAEDYSYISAYSYQLFLKDYQKRTLLNNDYSFGEDLTFTSNSLIIAKSLSDFLQVAEYALFLFLAITMIGAILILSIISFTNFCEDKKTTAILSIVGAKSSDVEDIYLNESLISGFSALLISLALSFPLSTLANSLIFKFVSIKEVINIPILKLFNIPFLYPLILLIGLVVIVVFASIIPIKFSQINSLKQELMAND